MKYETYQDDKENNTRSWGAIECCVGNKSSFGRVRQVGKALQRLFKIVEIV